MILAIHVLLANSKRETELHGTFQRSKHSKFPGGAWLFLVSKMWEKSPFWVLPMEAGRIHLTHMVSKFSQWNEHIFLSYFTWNFWNILVVISILNYSLTIHTSSLIYCYHLACLNRYGWCNAKKCAVFIVLLFKAWSIGQQHQHHLGTC